MKCVRIVKGVDTMLCYTKCSVLTHKIQPRTSQYELLHGNTVHGSCITDVVVTRDAGYLRAAHCEGVSCVLDLFGIVHVRSSIRSFETVLLFESQS